MWAIVHSEGLDFMPMDSRLSHEWIMSTGGDYVLDMFQFLLQKCTGLSASTAHLQVSDPNPGDLLSIQWDADSSPKEDGKLI